MQLGLLDVISVVITPMTWIQALQIAVSGLSGPAPPSGSWEVACKYNTSGNQNMIGVSPRRKTS